MQVETFDAQRALAPLKAFQRRSVDYVFHRMFDAKDATRQFLVADEVGLGKTMVARGVIAKAIERLRDTIQRIDVLYICSNQAISAQNINRLNVVGDDRLTHPTRLTLLPLQMNKPIKGSQRTFATNELNFVSLTPGTSFDQKSSTGVVEERAFLYHLLSEVESNSTRRRNFLQVGMKIENWRWHISQCVLNNVDRTIVERFLGYVREDEDFLKALREAFETFSHRRAWSYEESQARNSIIAKLRAKLARASVQALQPDLIILDEFQRFRDLLHGSSDAALLARELFDYTENGQAARTLLLSATPYKMLTLQGDAEEDGHHYRDFLDTVTFLYGVDRGREVAKSLEKEMKQFRDFLHGLPASQGAALTARDGVQDRLRRVISRTERVNNTVARDSMVREVPMQVSIKPADLIQAKLVSEVAKVLDAPDITEYWKSAPYLLNFMRNYALKHQLHAALKERNHQIGEALRKAQPALLSYDDIANYREVEPANGRLRALSKEIFDQGLDQHLWLPPSLPYYGGKRVTAPLTKALIFSSWSMVPDSIAALLSYEAERRAFARDETSGGNERQYFDKQSGRRLQFSTGERRTGLRAMLLICPSPILAAAVDPYAEFLRSGGELSLDDVRASAREQLAVRFRALVGDCASDGTLSNDWEWAGLAAMDAASSSGFTRWLDTADGLSSVAPASNPRVETEASGFSEHVAHLLHVAIHAELGPVPGDVLDTFVEVALGSPATCALRALHRVAPSLAWDDPALLTAAATVAWGFRTLFNQQESIALLRSESDDTYWRAVLQFCASHNLQAVLDEYAHYLVDAEGLAAKSDVERASGVASAMAKALGIRPAAIEVDRPIFEEGGVQLKSFRMRGRFAMRLADFTDDEGDAARLSAVRDSFNSPFRPFVLASTSVGQEGLDFHPYCYRIYHWNLPGNPVDLEQREGRIHRYKNHAVRLNLADAHGPRLRLMSEHPVEPWSAMFAQARSETTNESDLVPYWLFEGPVCVERRVPMLPFSREHERLEWLKRSLTVYRLAFGQPRQDDLLNYLTKLSVSMPAEDLAQLQISLHPRPLTEDENHAGDEAVRIRQQDAA